MIGLVLGVLFLAVAVGALVVLLRREPKLPPDSSDDEVDRIAAYFGARRRPGETTSQLRARLERDLS